MISISLGAAGYASGQNMFLLKKEEKPARPLLSEIVLGLDKAHPDAKIVKYVQDLQNAYEAMRARKDQLGLDGQVELHQLAAEQMAHENAYFLPWHRWMLYFHERLLGALIANRDFLLPIWDWETSIDLPDFISKDKSSPLYNSTRICAKETKPKLEGLRRDWKRLVTTVKFSTFFGQTKGNDSLSDFPGDAVGGPHAAIHNWVGGDMGCYETAGKDPLFYMHHANVDRMWSHRKWLSAQPGLEAIEELSTLGQLSDLLQHTFEFWDAEIGAQITPKKVTRSISQVMDLPDGDYRWKSFSIQITPSDLRKSLLLYDYDSHWAKVEHVLNRDTPLIPLNLVVDLPAHLSGRIEVQIRFKRRWMLTGHWEGVAHCDTHMKMSKNLQTNIRATIPRRDLPFSGEVEGRWISKSAKKPAPLIVKRIEAIL